MGVAVGVGDLKAAQFGDKEASHELPPSRDGMEGGL